MKKTPFIKEKIADQLTMIGLTLFIFCLLALAAHYINSLNWIIGGNIVFWPITYYYVKRKMKKYKGKKSSRYIIR